MNTESEVEQGTHGIRHLRGRTALGLARIEIAYCVLRRLWPERDDLQAAGTLACALIPMNLYMSQCAGNEMGVIVEEQFGLQSSGS